MSKEMTGAEMVIQAMLDQGVEYIFGYPGGAVLPIYDALFKQNAIRHILVRHEQAASLADVLLRRTRLGLLEARSLITADGPAPAVAEAMAPELGWDAERIGTEVERWLEVAAAEGIAVP